MPEKQTTLPDNGLGIREVADMAVRATGFEIINHPVKGLGDGLPTEVPLLVDKKAGGQVKSIKDLIETYRLEPERRQGTATVTTLASFIALCNYHKTEHSAIFADTTWPDPDITAVIDYHEKDKPHWCKHRITYPFPTTDELKAWVAGNGKPMEQLDFARFLEDHAAELTAPMDGERDIYERLFKERFATPSDLIALSRGLEIHVGAKVKRAERLQTGERTIEFVEDHMNANGEKVDIPGIFMVSVQAFVDGEPVRIPARLRYRIQSGSILWFFQLYRWEFFIRERVQEDLRKAGQETSLPTYEGTPEK